MRGFTRFSVVFAVTFIVNAAVIFLWDLIRSGHGSVDLATSAIIALVVAIVLTIINR